MPVPTLHPERMATIYPMPASSFRSRLQFMVVVVYKFRKVLMGMYGIAFLDNKKAFQ